jgi:hypothetical protein
MELFDILLENKNVLTIGVSTELFYQKLHGMRNLVKKGWSLQESLKKPSLCFFAKHIEEADVVLKCNEIVTFTPYPLFV